MKRFTLHILGLLVFFPTVSYAKSDTVRMSALERWAKHSFYVLPAVDYTPETSWTFGLSGANYFKIQGAKQTSSVTYYARYALNKQYSLNANTRLYIGEKAYVYTSLSVGKFPDYFYGIGNKEDLLLASPLAYAPMRLQIKAQPLWQIGRYWMMGPAFMMHYESMTHTPHRDLYPEFLMWGLGVTCLFDSRDNNFYPQKGTFFKALLLASEPTLGATTRVVQLQADLRQFVPINTCVLAFQFYADMLYQSENIPQLLPTIGGADVARGIRRGMWRDDVALALQAELRVPIWKCIKAAVFGNVADVYNWKNWEWTMPKIGYGAGIRLALNQAKVNIRFDVARNNYGDWKNFANPNTWNFYLTATEAF